MSDYVKYEQRKDLLEAVGIFITYEELSLVVSGKRIVVPELHASFRTAERYTRNEEIENEDGEDAWEIQSSVFVYYPEDEKILKNTFPLHLVI